MYGGFKPEFKNLKKTLPVWLVVVIIIYFLNKAWDTNFMFLNGGGSGNPLAWAENILGNPGYIIVIPVILAILWGIMYGVPKMIERKSKFST